MKTRQQRLSARGGFTLIELLIVIVIAGIVMGFAVPRLNGARAARGARNARDHFGWLAQRARARAIQTGQTQLLQLDPTTDRAWVVSRNTSDTLTTVNFWGEHKTRVTTPSNSNAMTTVCYSPRGYAYKWGSACNTEPASAALAITFTHVGQTRTAVLKRMGQVERP